MCPLKLDSIFEISHAAWKTLAGSLTTLCRSCDQPTARHLTAGRCRKNYICIWDSNISPRPRKNGSHEHTLFIAVRKNISPCGCQRADDFFCCSLLKSKIVRKARVRACGGVFFPGCTPARRGGGRIMVGLIGLEPMTPALSRRCSNQLSYRPVMGKSKISNSKF